MTSLNAPQLPQLKLRADVLFSRRSYTGELAYLIEDPINGQYYRIGHDEYRLIRQLDGTLSLPQALEQAKAQGNALEEAHLPQLTNWLIYNQLAYFKPQGATQWQLMGSNAQKFQRNIMRLNPLFIRLNLGSPDRMIQALLPWMEWMLGGWFFMLWLAIVGSGLYQLAAHWQDFSRGAEILLSANNLLWLLVAWTVIKTTHELFHGLVCKKYGGYIHQAGIFFILFAPIGGYVDATSSWRFASRWQRMHVAVAGMFIEILLAAIAVWVWIFTEPGALHYLAYNTIMIAGIVTLLFNANPLMRFDGYYVLADGLDIPNLYTLGQQYIRYLNRRWIQGRRESQPDLPHPWFVKAYGIATFAWRVIIMISLLYLANMLYPGVGILLAMLGILSWLFIPFGYFVMALSKDPQAFHVLRYMSLLLLGIILLGLLMLFQFHRPRTLHVPAIAEYANAQVVRAETPGFVRQIDVQSGQQVVAGQLLLRLENRELIAEQQTLAAQLKLSQAKAQYYLTDNEPALYQAEQENIKELTEKWAVVEQQVAHLTVTAPQNGWVVAENLRQQQDQYVHLGQELLTIGHPEQMELSLSISQEYIDFFRAADHYPVQVFFHRGLQPPLDATVSKVNPSASHEIIHPALSTLYGGPLAVRPRRQSSSEPHNQEIPYEYVYPRFQAKIALGTPQLANIALHPGETATVVLKTAPQSLSDLFYAAMERFYQHMALREQQNKLH